MSNQQTCTYISAPFVLSRTSQRRTLTSTEFIKPTHRVLSRPQTVPNVYQLPKKSPTRTFFPSPSPVSSLSASNFEASTPRATATNVEEDSLGLPPALRRYVDRFASVPDPKLRYQQLLFLAKELPPMDPSLKTEENRVHGCTSVVFVHVSTNDSSAVQLQGDSDSQLTKGLLALLVNGLENCDPNDVAKIDPQFITYSGLAASLTPSRNNGFVSMLDKIKVQVEQLTSSSSSSSENDETGISSSQEVEKSNDAQINESKPVYSALVTKLNVLKPIKLDIVDNSHMHAGHDGAKGLNGESHFSVSIVTDAFEGLTRVQRHRLIYTLMDEEMSAGHIHALQIDARTPSEIS